MDMRAAHVVQPGEPETALEIVELDIPEPGPKEVRIRVGACALNYKDVFTRKGHPLTSQGFPRQTGTDIAGVVDAVGTDVTRFESGQRVNVYPRITCGQCESCLDGEQTMCLDTKGVGESPSSAGEVVPGGLAEYVVLPASVLEPVPDSIDMVTAAAWPVTFTTAWRMVNTAADLRPSETVLVQGASGGVGNAALQLADRIGATTYATTSSDEKARAVSQWADEVIDYTETDFVERIEELTDGRGVDLVVDHVGEETWQDDIDSLAPAGRLVVCGATTGQDAMTNIRSIYTEHRRILGETLGNRRDFRDVGSLVYRGELEPQIYRTLPLEEIATGHRLLEERDVVGKIVFRPNE